MIKRKQYESLNEKQVAFKIVIVCAVIFTTIIATVKAQTYPPAKIITSFHFTMLTGGIIIVEARLDNFKDTLNFVLDTGSGGISLDSSTVEKLDLPLTKSNRTLKGIAGIRKISFVTGRTLQLPGIAVEHLDFHVTDYDLLSSVYGLKIDGIIGYSFFRRYIVKINYEDSSIQVWQPGQMKYPKGGFSLKRNFSSIPIISARVKDASTKEGEFYFDTGAGLCLLMSEDYERDSSILKKDKKIIITQVEGLGGKKPLRLSTVKEVKIGPYRFKKVPAFIFKDEFNVTSYPQFGGVIGNDLLRRFNLIINYPQNEIHLNPNGHLNEPFDYSYAGLSIYMTNGKIVIEDVIKDSPGDKAGLQPGDVLFAINNNFNMGIQFYKTMLQATGSKLKIFVMRDGVPIMTTIRIASIL